MSIREEQYQYCVRDNNELGRHDQKFNFETGKHVRNVKTGDKYARTIKKIIIKTAAQKSNIFGEYCQLLSNRTKVRFRPAQQKDSNNKSSKL